MLFRSGMVYAQSNQTQPPKEKPPIVSTGNEASSPNTKGDKGQEEEVLVSEQEVTNNASGNTTTRVKTVSQVKITTTSGKQVKDKLVVSGPEVSFGGE